MDEYIAAAAAQFESLLRQQLARQERMEKAFSVGISQRRITS